MRCNEAVSFMQEDLDHHLNPVQREKLLLHIEQCSSCMELYWRLKLLEKDIAPLPQIKPPYSLVDRVLPKLPIPDSTGSRAAIVRPLQKSSKQLDRQFRFHKRRFRRYGLGIVATVFGFCMVSLGFTISSLQTEVAVDAGEIFITAEQSEAEPVQLPSDQNIPMEEKPSSPQKVESVHVEPVKTEKKDDRPNVKQLVKREVQQSPKETVSKPNREKPSSQPAAEPSKPKEDTAEDTTEPDTPPVQPQPDKDEINKQIVGKFQEINQNQLKTRNGQLIASNENQKVIIRNADKTIVYSSSFQWKQDDIVQLVGWNGNNSFIYEVASGNLTQKFVIQIQDKVEQPVNS
jgi:hypothetical protein